MDIFIYEVEIVNVYKQGKLGQDLLMLVCKQMFWLGIRVDRTTVLIPAPSFLESTEKKVWKMGLETGRGGEKKTLGDYKLCV